MDESQPLPFLPPPAVLIPPPLAWFLLCLPLCLAPALLVLLSSLSAL